MNTLIFFIYLGLVTLVIWILAVRSHQPMRDKVAALLQLIAVYTLILGLLSSSGIFKIFNELQLELTSPNPIVFLKGNCLLFMFIFGGIAIAWDPVTKLSELHSLLVIPLLFIETVLLFGYVVIHFLAIVPVAYFGYLLTSAPIDAILNAGSDVKITIGKDAIQLKELIQQNEAAVRNFAVSLPAFAVSFMLKIWPLLRGKKKWDRPSTTDRDG